MYAGHGIVLHKHLPRLFEVALLGVGQPTLDVLARRASMVARRQQIHVNGTLNTSRPRELTVLQVGGASHVTFFLHLSPRQRECRRRVLLNGQCGSLLMYINDFCLRPAESPYKLSGS